MSVPHTIVVALAGNPNCGKTSIFNNLTGSRHRVANYPGVTVEKRESDIEYKGRKLQIVDLPGTYSLSAFSLEEVVARDFLVRSRPDVVVDVVDAGNLERNLYLTAQLIDLHCPLVLALNMMDVAQDMHIKIDQKQLGLLVGAPVAATVGRANEGMEGLLDAIIEVAENPQCATRRLHLPYGEAFENEIATVKALVAADPGLTQSPYYHRWLAARAIENDPNINAYLKKTAAWPAAVHDAAEAGRKRLENFFSETIDGIVADRIYSFAHGLCAEVADFSKQRQSNISNRIDRVLTDKWLGFPVFILVTLLMFHCTFAIGEIPMGWIEWGVDALRDFASSHMEPGSLRNLVADGVIGGVGGVLVFLPSLLILFLFLSLLEDTGYMARAAFLMDRVMHALGLHGKSFISLLTGFGCNVAGVMAARTLESREDRLITILINPLMSCAARYPVYVLFAAAFFPHSKALVILSLYALGLLLAVAMGKLFRRVLFKGQDTPFVMELPPYRIPTVKSIALHLLDKCSLFLRKAGSVILAGAVLLWALHEFPRPAAPASLPPAIAAHAPDNAHGMNSPAVSPDLQSSPTSAAQSNYAARFGLAIEPIIKPLGFDWRMGVSLIPGFFAKETVVSSLGVVFGAAGSADDEDEGTSRHLRDDLRNAYNPLTAYCFMVFTLLYTPCLATLAVIRREAGGWRWVFFSIGYTLILAWTITFLIRQLGLLAGLG